jgi:hypothetical protein
VGGLFAQELKFDGSVNSGLGLIVTDQQTTDPENPTKSKAVDPYITAYGVDAQSPGYQFRLNGVYTNADGNAGARFRFQSKYAALSVPERIVKGTTETGNDPFTVTVPGTELGLSFAIPYAYGWVKFLDGVITLNGGLVDDASFGSGGVLLANRWGDDPGEGLGALVKLTPIPGLDFGLGAYTVSINGGGANNSLARPLNSKVELDEIKYTFGLAYNLPDLLKFTASFRAENDTNRIPPAGSSQTARAVAGIKILAVPGLTAILEAEFDRLQDFSETGTIRFLETLGYKVGSLGFGLNSGQYLSQVTDSDIGLEFAPWVDYTLGSVVPRLDLVYFLGGTSNPALYHRVASYSSATDNNNDYNIFSVRPSVKFNIDAKTSIEIGDVIHYEKGPEGSYGHPEDVEKANRLTNVFYVDFKWSF